MSLNKFVNNAVIAGYVFVACTYAIPVTATITPIQSLNFGTIAVTNNSFVSSITIAPNGNVQVVGGIAILSAGNHAVYEISDFPNNRTLNVDVTVINTEMLSQTASEETFSFSVLTNSDTIVTDNNGMAMLAIGGRIETSGNGSIRFSDTAFESTIQITVDL